MYVITTVSLFMHCITLCEAVCTHTQLGSTQQTCSPVDVVCTVYTCSPYCYLYYDLYEPLWCRAWASPSVLPACTLTLPTAPLPTLGCSRLRSWMRDSGPSRPPFESTAQSGRRFSEGGKVKERRGTKPRNAS